MLTKEEITKAIKEHQGKGWTGRNVLSEPKFIEHSLKPFVPDDFQFDLQLFGGGGGGKRGIKAVLAIGAFFFGAGHLGMAIFGASSSFAGGLLAVSLFSSIWALGSRGSGNSSYNGGSASVVRFDREQEAMSLGGVIPVVYGRRMVQGNQTYHQTDADSNNLHKHVILCEGGIEGIETLTAQGLNVVFGSNTSRAVLTIQNLKHQDAWVESQGRTLVLYAGGVEKRIDLKTESDMQGDEIGASPSYYAWQLEVGSLVAYINKLGNGWEAFPVATTSRYAGDLICGDYVGQNSWRKDGGDPWKARFEKDGMICIAVPGTYREESHWHHLRKRKAYYITADCFRTARRGAYKNFVQLITTHTVGLTSLAYHDGDLPDNYQEVGSYRNMVWLDMRFTVSDNLGGNPTISALVKGRKIYDTRHGQWEYSTNPAMCLRDLLLNKSYGAGQFLSASDLDEDSFKEAADWCDQYVRYKLVDGTVVDTKRYELNLIMDNKQTVWDWAQQIMATFCGYMVLSKNKIHLRIEKATPTSYAFSESSIKEMSLSQTSLEECPNQYRVKFVDPLNNWKTATIVVDDYSDQRERHRVITKEVELEGVTSQAQALRLARFYRDYNKICTLQVEFKTGYEAIHLEPGDVVTLTYKNIFCDAPFRITEIKETENGEYTIKGRQYNHTIYNDSLGATITTYNYATVTPSFGVPRAPANVWVNVVDDVLEYPITRLNARISWDESITNRNVSYNIYRSYGNDTWEFLGNTTATTFTVEEAQDTRVTYGVSTVSAAGLASKRTDKAAYLHLTDEPPAKPRNIRVSMSGATVYVSWESNHENDFDHYEIEFWNNKYTTKESSFTGKGRDGSNTITIRAYDVGGNYSTSSKTFTMTLKPADINFVAVNKENGYINLSWPESDGATYYTITGSANLITYEPKVSIHVNKTGSFTYYIRACNNYDTSKEYKVTVSMTSQETATGQTIMTVNLFDGITLDDNLAWVVEGGVNTIIKKET